ncbi:MAG: 4-(cytidine 5'-diphospho)-2-C-methyl-D-erythritol kinase [Candidatus Poribacteria bacterium]|nr:4-(cytidine 5'-diphospho)-2-C-methyl-D-erythritol kinase [Candidatus Poribacteria bacterium]
MRNLRVRAHAKINLYLNVVGKRKDGYHNLETIFHSIGLHDDVIIRKQNTKHITVHCEHPAVPSDARNLAHRAAQCLSDAVGGIGGIAIEIFKRIPVAAGLAGGSANAAAVLHGVNELFGLGFTQEPLMRFGAQLGADVPFCLHGGAALGLGIGDQLTRLPVLSDLPLLLLNPGVEISTAAIFKKLNFPLTKPEKDGIIIRTYIEKGDILSIGKNLYNLLEIPVFSEHPEIAALKTALSTQPGCCGALMSGSGATLFAIMHDSQAARQSESHFRNRNKVNFCETTVTSPVGVYIDG